MRFAWGGRSALTGLEGPSLVVTPGKDLWHCLAATDGSSEMERELFGITRQHGLELLARHQLEQPVTFPLEKASPARTRMFNVLFSDTDFLPWERTPGD